MIFGLSEVLAYIQELGDGLVAMARVCVRGAIPTGLQAEENRAE